jgi:hypothetical protein
MARSQGTGRVRYILQCPYTTWTRTSTTIILGPSLTGLRGTQVTGSISYTLVNGSPPTVHSARRWDRSPARHPQGNLRASCQQQNSSLQSLSLRVLLAFGPSRGQEHRRTVRRVPTFCDKAPCTRIGATHHTCGLALRAMGARPSGTSTQVVMRQSHLPLSRSRQVLQVDQSSPDHQPRSNYDSQVLRVHHLPIWSTQQHHHRQQY